MWLVIGLTMILLFQLFNKPQGQSNSITYSEFWSNVESGAISKVSIQGEEITGIGQDGRPFKTVAPNDTGLIPMLRDSDVDISVKKPEETPWYLTILFPGFRCCC
jgi:ATP-dependent Zn proteases